MYYFYYWKEKAGLTIASEQEPNFHTAIINPVTMEVEKDIKSPVEGEMAGSAYGELMQNCVMYDDADSGEFTYFCIAPDTNDTTYHIELRYGSDLEALGKYDEGDYAYWLGSGISTDYDQTMVENCIELFCKENLSE